MSQARGVVVRNCNLTSFQDTIRVNGSAYFKNCKIEGDVDFIWGDGVGYFDRCTIHSLNRGYVVQARNGEAAHGFIFNRCRLTGTPDAAGTVLARINPAEYPYSEVVYLNCAMDRHITPQGWRLDHVTSAPKVRFYEYATTDLNGKPRDLSARLPDATLLTPQQAEPYLDPAALFGSDSNTR